jgi:6-phosphogluconolactonase
MSHGVIRLLIGTYTEKLPHVDGKGKGVYELGWNSETSKFGKLSVAFASDNPSWLHRVDKSDKVIVLTANELANGNGSVGAWLCDENGEWKSFGAEVSSHGVHPCHLAQIDSGKVNTLIAVSNYAADGSGGTVAFVHFDDERGLGKVNNVVAFDRDGSAAVRSRQMHSHAHCVVSIDGGRLLALSDLGRDSIEIYDAEKRQLAQSWPLARGAGPRTIAAIGTTLFVGNELDSTLALLDTANGGASLRVQSTLPENADRDAVVASQSSTVGHLSVVANRVVVANRGDDSLASFNVDGELLALSPAGGRTPRHFASLSAGTDDNLLVFVANQDSDNVTALRFDASSGKFTQLDSIDVPTPVFVLPI